MNFQAGIEIFLLTALGICIGRKALFMTITFS